jgi:hypothetical protein
MSSSKSRGWSLCCASLALLVLVLASATCARADWVGLNFNEKTGIPDIDSLAINVTYDYCSAHDRGFFSAVGLANSLNLYGAGASPGDPDRPYITGYSGGDPDFSATYGSFAIAMGTNGAGTPAWGCLTIAGDIPALSIFGSTPDTLGTLLKGTLAGFGYSTDDEGDFTEFDFLFKVTADGTGTFGVGSDVGVILTPDQVAGGFSADFQNDGQGISDTFAVPVPEPTTRQALGLLGPCGALCGLFLWRRKKAAPR